MAEHLSDDVKDAIRQAGVLGFRGGQEHLLGLLLSDEVVDAVGKKIAEVNFWDWDARDVRLGLRRSAGEYLQAAADLLAGEPSSETPRGEGQ